MTMSNKELMLISHLRKNCRQNLTTMSKSIQMPISTIFDRIKKYEQSLIIKHTALIDFAKLGYTAKASFLLKVKREQRDALKEYLLKNFSINSIYKVNNDYDFMVEGVFKDVKEREDFIEGIEDKFQIRKKEVYHIIDEIRREAFMSDPLTVQYCAA